MRRFLRMGNELDIIIELFNPEKGMSKIENYEGLLRFAEKNNVLYALSYYILKNKINIPKKFHNSLKKELEHGKKMEKQMIELWRKSCSLFLKQGLRVMSIKSFLKYPYYDSDLDVVCMSDIRNYLNVLEKNGYKFKTCAPREPGKYLVYGKMGKTTLHLHSQLSWNGVTYIDKKIVWKRKISSPVYKPSAEDEILIIAAHRVYEEKSIEIGDLLELYKIIKSNNIDWDYVKETAKKNNWLSGLVLFMSIANSFFTQRLETNISEFPIKKIKSDFPLIIPYRNIFLLSLNKTINDIFTLRMKSFLNDFYAYSLDALLYFKNIRRIKC